ncbi:MAG: hypothetical protein J5903_03180, partial [Clostridia bacterium]|nr:hypothetical protein [Clostridia bacterium]
SPTLATTKEFTVEKAAGGEAFDEISDVCYSEGKFYALRTVLENGATHPEIYVIDPKEKTSEKVAGVCPAGNGGQMTADVFGSVYYTSEKDGVVQFVRYSDGAYTVLYTEEKENILNLQVDFSGKLYALYEGGKVRRIDSGDATEKTVRVRESVEGVGDPRSICLSYSSKTAYFIFSGLILKTSDPSDLAVSTPDDVAIPDGFDLGYSGGRKFAKIKKNAVLFGVKEDFSGNTFASAGLCRSDGEKDYAIEELDGFVLAVCDEGAFLARTEEITQTFYAREADKTAYALVDFRLFSLPVTNGSYACGETKKHSRVTVLGELCFNGEKYCALDNGESTGYIPCGFLSEIPPEKSEAQRARSAYVGKNGLTVYSDESMTEIAETLGVGTKIKILYENDGKAKIDHDGKTGFAYGSEMTDHDPRDFAKAAIAVLVALSLCVTAIFFEKKYLFREKGAPAEDDSAEKQ